MNDLKDTKTADLIAEWSLCKRAITYISNRESSHGGVWQRAKKQRCFNETERIATELDMRCVEAGISIVDGLPTFVCIIRESVVSRGIPFTTITVDVEATELHALLGWLLLKEGGGNA